MTISSSVSKATLNGDGVQTGFPFAFKVWKAGDLEVSITSPTGANTVVGDWTVELAGSGGTVTYPTVGDPLPLGWKITLRRFLDFLQDVDLVSGTRFDPEVIETALDIATAERQQLLEEISRTVRVGVASGEDPANVVNQVFGARDAAVSAALVAEASANLVGPLLGPEGSSLVGFLQSGTVAVARTVQDKSRDIVSVKDFGAVGDGVTNDTTAINSASAYCSANKLGLYFPPGRYGCTNLRPYSDVDYFGAGVMSQLFLIENAENTAHIFYVSGVNRATYYLRNWKALNNISPGRTVTLPTVADAESFGVGELVLIASATEGLATDSDWQPRFSLLNKVLSVNTATGVLTLESPIFDSMTGMRIAKQNDFTGALPAGYGPDYWCANSSFHDLYIDVSTAPAGIQAQFLSTSGLYRCKVYDITINGACHVHSANADCYTTWDNIVCKNMDVATGTFRLYEIKTGSYASSYKNTRCDSSEIATSNMAWLEAGEYAQRIDFDGVTLIAPGLTNTDVYVVGVSGTAGDNYIFKNVHMDIAGCSSFATMGGGGYEIKSHIFKDLTIKCPSCAYIFRTQAAINGVSFIVDGVTAMLPPTAAAIYVSTLQGFTHAVIKNVVANGALFWGCASPYSSYGVVDLSITDCKLKGVLIAHSVDPATHAQPWQYNVRNISRFEEDAVNSVTLPVEKDYQNLVLATGDTTLIDALLPQWDAWGWTHGDVFEFEVDAQFIGTAGNKTVTLFEATELKTIATITSSAANTYTIKGKICIYNYQSTTKRVSYSVERLGSDGTITITKDLFALAGAMRLQLKTNIAAAGDQIRLYKTRIKPRLAYSANE